MQQPVADIEGSRRVVLEIPFAIRVLSDGTVVRYPEHDFLVGEAAGRQPEDDAVQWKDVVYEPDHDLKLRIYAPRRLEGGAKLPVLVFFHGGGFCIGSFSWPTIHVAMLRLANEIPAVIVSVDYRLAPEHRLPAAIEDTAKSILWLRDQAAATAGTTAESWLAEYADFSNVFISGESAGGNLAHHAAVRFAGEDLAPVKIRGYALLVPGFSGEQKMKSELQACDGSHFTPELQAAFLRLALPEGVASFNHSFRNPFAAASPDLGKLDLAPMLVMAAERDILRDRNVHYAERLQAMGKTVELVEYAGVDHGFFCNLPRSPSSDKVVQDITKFVHNYSFGDQASKH